MYRSRCILVTSLLLLIVAGFWGVLRVAAPTAAEETVAGETSETPQQTDAACDCGTRKMLVMPRDPQEREALLQRLKQERRAREAALIDAGRRRNLQWDGCKFNTAAKEGDNAFAEQKEVADYFFAMQPNPAERMAHFNWLSPPDRYVIVGWGATVMNVSQTKQGKSVELQVRPTLATRGGNRAVFTPFCLQEFWTLQKDKEPTYESCKPCRGEIRIGRISYGEDTAKIIFED